MNSGALYPRFTDGEMARRSAAVRAAMQEAGLAALIFYSTASTYQEVLYLSNFQATQEAMLLFPYPGKQAPGKLLHVCAS